MDKLKSFNREEDDEFLRFLRDVPRLLGSNHIQQDAIKASELTEKLGFEKEIVTLRLRSL